MACIYINELDLNGVSYQASQILRRDFINCNRGVIVCRF